MLKLKLESGQVCKTNEETSSLLVKSIFDFKWLANDRQQRRSTCGFSIHTVSQDLMDYYLSSWVVHYAKRLPSWRFFPYCDYINIFQLMTGMPFNSFTWLRAMPTLVARQFYQAAASGKAHNLICPEQHLLQETKIHWPNRPLRAHQAVTWLRIINVLSFSEINKCNVWPTS